MNINRIQEILTSSIKANSSVLTDFYQGSVNYTLVRGIAGGLLDLYNKIDNLNNTFIINNAIGEDLDKLGNSFNIIRKQGVASSGYVLAENIDSKLITIPPNLILSSSLNLQQYRVNELKEVRINPYTSQRLSIVAIEKNNTSNIKAGSLLLNPNYPFVNFTVGSYKSTTGLISGDITNGINIESDLEYRNRILQQLFNPFTNYSNLNSLLINEGDIQRVLYETVQLGLVNIWLLPTTTLTSTRLTNLQTLINDNLPPGITSNLSVLIPKKLNFIVRAYNNLSTNNLKSFINIYLNQLKYGQSLVINDLKEYLITNIKQPIDIVVPNDSILTVNDNETFVLELLEVLYSA